MDNNTAASNQILENLLHLEEYYLIQQSYFTANTKVTRQMRAKLVTWMLEVCEEQRLTDDLFALSVNLFDRLMHELIVRTQFNVEIGHLQLFGITCLFIAAKLKAKAHIMTSQKLVEYTDNSVRLEELLEWELLVLDKLRWDIAAIVPNDYADILIGKFKYLMGDADEEQVALVKKHYDAFTALCSLDFKFAFYPASMVAGASLLTAIDGLIKTKLIHQQDSHSGSDNQHLLVNHLALDVANLINCDIDSLLQVKELVDNLYASNMQHPSEQPEMQQQEPHQQQQQQLESNQFINLPESNLVQFEDDYDFDLDYNLDCLSLEMQNEFLSTSPNNHSSNSISSNNNNNDESGNSSSSSAHSFAHYSPFLFEQENLIVCSNKPDKKSTKSKKSSHANNTSKTSNSSSTSNKKSNYYGRYNSSYFAAQSGFSRSSSSSSGISSIASNTNYATSCSMLTPPMANLVPLPSF
jgi:cyclin D2